LIRAQLLLQTVHHAVEGRPDLGEFQLGLRQVSLGLRLGQFRLVQRHLVRGDHLVGRQAFRVTQFQLSQLGLGLLGLILRLVQGRQDLEHQLALLDRLAFVDVDRLEEPALQRADLDVAA